MTNSLVALSEHLASTVQAAGQSTVAIHARPRFDSSGVHWSPGIVVTADHTIQRDEEIHVTNSSGSVLKAELVGRDPGTDLAVLRVAGLDSPVATRAKDAILQSGSLILAVGRFKGSASASFGIISSVSGPSQSSRGGRLDQVVRLDVALHPAASGGAVINASGELIGIATPALSRASVFAIPLSTVERVSEKLLKHGRIPSGYLGVGFQGIAVPEQLKTKLKLTASTALIAVSVDPHAPAGQAGMMIGDVLLELGGRAIERPENVQEVLDADSIGKKLPARILRGGDAMELQITVGERPRRG